MKYKISFFTSWNQTQHPENIWEMNNDEGLLNCIKGCLNPKSGMGKIVIEKLEDSKC